MGFELDGVYLVVLIKRVLQTAKAIFTIRQSRFTGRGPILQKLDLLLGSPS
jgi:hypothetical protein